MGSALLGQHESFKTFNQIKASRVPESARNSKANKTMINFSKPSLISNAEKAYRTPRPTRANFDLDLKA